MPALRHLQGPLLAMVGDALYSPADKNRGLFRPEYVDTLLQQPNEHRTPVGYHKLWLLGLWLQSHDIK